MLDHQLLWTFLNPSLGRIPPALLPELLTRSGDLPLNICIDTRRISEDVLRVISGESKRLKGLSINFGAQELVIILPRSGRDVDWHSLEAILLFLGAYPVKATLQTSVGL